MPFEFNGIETTPYIGIVCGFDKTSRKLEVFVPKLMPLIARDMAPKASKTNLNPDIIDPLLSYQGNISTASTITVRAEDMDEPLPDIGSRVKIWFLEQNLRYGFWAPFNPNNDYSVIESERYKDLHYLSINGREIEIQEDDRIEIELPYTAEIVYNQNGKNKRLSITKDSLSEKIDELERRLSQLEKKLLEKD